MRRRAAVGFAIGLGSVLVAMIACLIYLTQADLGRHRGLVEESLARASGYEVAIAELHVDLSLFGASQLEARDLTVSNPAWGGNATCWPSITSPRRSFCGLSLAETEVHLDKLEATFAGSELTVEGSIGRGSGAIGTTLRVTA